MILLYKGNQEVYRSDYAKRIGEAKKTGAFQYVEVVHWMGERAEMLLDDTVYTPVQQKSQRVQRGVIIRIAHNIPKPVMTFLTKVNNSSDEGERADARAVLHQRFMSPQSLWDTAQNSVRYA